jgi:hypothetical protein
VNSFLTTPNCNPLSLSDASCACSDATSVAAATDCFFTSCSRRESLNAQNITTIACDQPVRDKSKSYRLINVIFFSMALVALAARWTAHITVGRFQWLDEANMIVVLVGTKSRMVVPSHDFADLGHRLVFRLLQDV